MESFTQKCIMSTTENTTRGSSSKRGEDDRKSLNVSVDTYKKIDAIRTRNRRSFKAELEIIIDKAYDEEFGSVDDPQSYRSV